MSTIGRSKTVTGLLLALALSVTGCTVGRITTPIANSHFDYPNSNITPLGRVTGESSLLWVFFPVMQDADLQEEAYQKALAQKGGDMLLDAVSITKITMIPIPYIPLYYTSYEIEGTAAKMEIGKQTLR